MFLQGSPYKQAKLANYFQAKSKIPLVVAIDAEWGVQCVRFIIKISLANDSWCY